METRKVQKVGGSTYTVSLPKSWADEQGVEAGTTVYLDSHIDGTVVVRTERSEGGPSRRAQVRVDHERVERLERTVRALYAAGFETMRFDADGEFTREQRQSLRRVSETLVGASVVEESASSATVRTLLDAGEVSVRQSVVQLQFVALSAHRSATAGLRTGTWEGDDALSGEARRLHAMVQRHFTRSLTALDEVDALGVDRPELFDLCETARELARVADCAARIAALRSDLSVTDAEVGDEVAALAQSSRAVVEDGTDAALGEGDVEAVHGALDAQRAVRDEVATVKRALFDRDDADYRLVEVVECLSRTADHGGTVAEVALRAAARRGDLGRRTGGTAQRH